MPRPQKIKRKRKEKKKATWEKKNKIKGKLKKPMCTCIWAFLSIKKKFIPIQFSLHFREKAFWWAQRKHLGPTIYFPSFPPNQTHSKRVILPIFPPKFFIHPILPPSKHTLKVVILLFFFRNFRVVISWHADLLAIYGVPIVLAATHKQKAILLLTSGEVRISLRGGGGGERERET